MANAVFIPIRKGDWAYAQVQYESTDRPIKDIGIEIGVTDMAVIDRATRYRWTRGKNQEAMKQATEIILAQKDEKKQRLLALERVNAEMQAACVYEHRQDIGKARKISQALLTELSTDTELDLPEKAKVLKNLAESMKTLVALERQAFGIVGVLEDPEKPDEESASPADKALAGVLTKFASVLSRVAPPAPTIVVDVNGPPN